MSMVKFFISLERKYTPLMDHTHGMVIVLDALSRVLPLGGPVIEIGTRLGGSALAFLEVIDKSNNDNCCVTVDPYGSLPFHTCENPNPEVNSHYDEDMYRRAMFELSRLCLAKKLDHIHFKCMSTWFMEQYDVLTLFKNGKQELMEGPCFVYLDGDHKYKIQEIDFFLSRLKKGGCIVVDDSEPMRSKLDEHYDAEYKLSHIDGNRTIIQHKEAKTFLNHIQAYKHIPNDSLPNNLLISKIK